MVSLMFVPNSLSLCLSVFCVFIIDLSAPVCLPVSFSLSEQMCWCQIIEKCQCLHSILYCCELFPLTSHTETGCLETELIRELLGK